jgi:hypothetical protein
MNDWNRLLVQLDKTIGFPQKIHSSVKKRWQGYDQWKNEHVIWLEYRHHRICTISMANQQGRPDQWRQSVNSWM